MYGASKEPASSGLTFTDATDQRVDLLDQLNWPRFVLNLGLGMFFHDPLAYLEDVTIMQQNTGFSSGHAMMSLITYGLLIYELRSQLAQRYWLMVIGAMIMLMLLIGYSWMFFGFHYLSDAVGGYAAGLFWLSLCLSTQALLPVTIRSSWARTAEVVVR